MREALSHATSQLRLDGSKAFELQLCRGYTGVERCSDHTRLVQVYHFDALVTHSHGAVLYIPLLDARRVFDPSPSPGWSARPWFTASVAVEKNCSWSMPVLPGTLRQWSPRCASDVMSL